MLRINVAYNVMLKFHALITGSDLNDSKTFIGFVKPRIFTVAFSIKQMKH